MFLISIDLLVTSLGYLGAAPVAAILEVTANPFISLFIGLLVTALIQSSSTTTSMIVALVASGSIDLQRAIPIIMGANIGTTLTNNIVSLSFITRKKEFLGAFSTATLHDHFNILVTLILFPLQYKYNLLGRVSNMITDLAIFQGDSHFDQYHSVLHSSNMIIGEWILSVIENPKVGLAIALILLFGSIKLLTKVIYRTIIGTTRLKFEKLVFKNRRKSFLWGLIFTASVQSSSVATSLVVPLVATGAAKIRSVYPFIIGANIGTTITALLASLFKTPEAVSIAVAHLLFNLVGGVIFLFVPVLNKLPILMSEALGDICLKYRIISIIYIIITFFLLPFAFIYMFK